MSFSEVLEIKQWFKGQHIALSTDWIQACIEFVRQEQRSKNLSAQQLKNYIYEQWLVADLEQISVSTLPHQLQSTQKVTLNGAFALQVNGMRDISKPAYTQLKEIEGSQNDNIDVSATPRVALPEWEAKPTRMLLLNLTDGCTHIQGMEYKPIPFLSPNLPPGIKVLIKGPVDCRFGVVMLSADKLQILGGEVESSLGQFSRAAILREMLQLPSAESPTPANTNVNSAVQPSTNPTSINQQSILHQSISNQSNINQSSSRSSSAITNLNQSDIRSYSIGSTRHNNNQVTNNCKSNSSDTKKNSNSFGNQMSSNRFTKDSACDDLDQFGSDDDDFVQNLDYNKIDELERTSSQKCDEEEEFNDWHEDEDVFREQMAFQELETEIELPFEYSRSVAREQKQKRIETGIPFTYLSTISKECASGTIITIKGFIITVTSKLSCTADEGWQLTVKINDGTASVDADIHDKVLEKLIGIPAIIVIEKQSQSDEDVKALKKIKEAVSNCKLKLQNLNCLMDIKFSPGRRPCIVNCSTIDKSHIQQLLDRVKANEQNSPEIILLS